METSFKNINNVIIVWIWSWVGRQLTAQCFSFENAVLCCLETWHAAKLLVWGSCCRRRVARLWDSAVWSRQVNPVRLSWFMAHETQPESHCSSDAAVCGNTRVKWYLKGFCQSFSSYLLQFWFWSSHLGCAENKELTYPFLHLQVCEFKLQRNIPDNLSPLHKLTFGCPADSHATPLFCLCIR